MFTNLVDVAGASGIVAELGLTKLTDQITNELTNHIKREFLITAANPNQSQPAGSFAGLMQVYLNKVKPEVRTRFQQTSAELLRASPVVQQALLGRPTTTGQTTGAQFALSPALAHSLQRGLQSKLLLSKAPPIIVSPLPQKPPPAQPARYKKLGFYITAVTCVEETDELSASDEILLSGVGIYPSGALVQPAVWTVSEDFDAGEVVSPVPPRLFAEFDLSVGTHWPKSYVVSVVLAEEDSGGFGDFIRQLWANVHAEAVAAVTAAAGAAIGTAVGSALGGILGAIAGAVFGAIIGWLIELFDNPDDLIGTQTWVLTLATDTHEYFAGLPIHGPVAPAGNMRFIGDGGHYEVTMFWKVYD